MWLTGSVHGVAFTVLLAFFRLSAALVTSSCEGWESEPRHTEALQYIHKAEISAINIGEKSGVFMRVMEATLGMSAEQWFMQHYA